MEPVSNTAPQRPPQQLPALGIDVSKRSLEVALLAHERLRTKSFRNDESGFEALSRWLCRMKAPRVHACLEATGGYEEEAALYLLGARHVVSVVNPRRIAAYAKARLQRNKTDRADAALIARFCERERPAPWQAPPPAYRQLRHLTRGLDALKQQRDQTRNRRGVADAEPLRQALDEVLKTLEEQIAALEAQVEEYVAQHPELRERQRLLCSIPGVGRQTAAVVLGEVGPVERFTSARAVAAYAGLTPRNYTSGTSVLGRTRLSKVGNARLRRALFFPAMSALRHNEAVRHFGDRLERAGKAGKAIVGASMRKLLHICYGVLKSGTEFDASLHLST